MSDDSRKLLADIALRLRGRMSWANNESDRILLAVAEEIEDALCESPEERSAEPLSDES